MDRKEYNAFIDALLTAERIELHEVDQLVEHGVKAGHHRYFEGCLPIEVMAQRGRDALAFGPFRPVGMVDPRSGKQPRAVVQLRQDNLAGTHYNLVGFQTNLKYSEQERIVRMIPGLEKAQFVRYGQMHRNTFLYSPGLLQPTMQCLHRTDIFIAGQITGVEGYVGSIGTGLLAGWNAANQLNGKPLVELPRTTMLGGLCYYITHAKAEDFQPMKANFGILPSLLEGHRLGRRDRARLYSQRAKNDLTMFLSRVTPE